MAKAYTLPGDGSSTDNRINRRSTRECLNILTADDFEIFSGGSGRLNYDGGSVDFTVGDTVTGTGSGHTAIIDAIVGTTVSGYLVLNEASGIFQNNEVISDVGGGAAVANQTLAPHTGIWTGFTVAEAAVFAALTTGYEDKRNVLATHTFPAGFKIVADLRSIQLTSGVIMAHKINED